MDRLICGECIDCTYGQDDPATLFNLAIKETDLRPKVIVTYERKAFVYDWGNVRITLDRNVRGSNDILHFGKKELAYDFVRECDAVLEVKYDEFLPDTIKQILNEVHLTKTAFSKYYYARRNQNIYG